MSTVVSSMRTARSGACSAELNGVIFIFGGHDGSAQLNTMEVYDPASQTCTLLPNKMCSAREDACCAVVGGSVYIFGGYDGKNMLNTIERFDPVSKTCTVLNVVLCSGRHSASAVVWNDVAYIIGGINETSTKYRLGFFGFVKGTCDTIEVFDPRTSSCTLFPTKISVPRSRHASVVVGGVLWIFGGHRTSPVEVLPISNSAKMPNDTPFVMDRYVGLSSAVLHGSIYLFGGTSPVIPCTDQIYRIDASSGDVQFFEGKLSAARSYSSSAVFNNIVYLFGGKDRSPKPLDTIEIFVPPPPSTEPTKSLLCLQQARETRTAVGANDSFLEQLTGSLEKFSDGMRKLTDDLSKCTSERDSALTKVSKLTSDNKKLTDDFGTLQKDIESVTQERDDLLVRIRELERQLLQQKL